MTSVLHVNASVRPESQQNGRTGSISRALGSQLLNKWRSLQPTLSVVERDLAASPPGFVDHAWIEAAFTDKPARTEQQKARLKESDELIHEVHNADVVVIGTPMYNYGMPAPLKAWFDQVVRINETFSFNLARGDYPLAPIQSGKILVLLTSSGEFGFGQNGERAHMNHLGPHIRIASNYLGIQSVHEIGVEYPPSKLTEKCVREGR